jgi:hypothetical protein
VNYHALQQWRESVRSLPALSAASFVISIVVLVAGYYMGSVGLLLSGLVIVLQFFFGPIIIRHVHHLSLGGTVDSTGGVNKHQARSIGGKINPSGDLGIKKIPRDEPPA